MTEKKSVANYPPEEIKRRFETALRGARTAGPQHAESVTPKKRKAQRKKRKKAKA